MALKNSDGKIISRPAGKDDKIDVTAINCEKIKEEEGQAIEKLVETASKEYQGVRSTDLTLGSTVKAYDGGKPKELGKKSHKADGMGIGE